MAKVRKTHGANPYTNNVAMVNTSQVVASLSGDTVEYVHVNGRSAVTIGINQATEIANRALLVVMTVRYFNGFTMAM